MRTKTKVRGLKPGQSVGLRVKEPERPAEESFDGLFTRILRSPKVKLEDIFSPTPTMMPKTKLSVSMRWKPDFLESRFKDGPPIEVYRTPNIQALVTSEEPLSPEQIAALPYTLLFGMHHNAHYHACKHGNSYLFSNTTHTDDGTCEVCREHLILDTAIHTVGDVSWVLKMYKDYAELSAVLPELHLSCGRIKELDEALNWAYSTRLIEPVEMAMGHSLSKEVQREAFHGISMSWRFIQDKPMTPFLPALIWSIPLIDRRDMGEREVLVRLAYKRRGEY